MQFSPFVVNNDYLELDLSKSRNLTSFRVLRIHDAIVQSVKSPLLEGLPYLTKLELGL